MIRGVPVQNFNVIIKVIDIVFLDEIVEHPGGVTLGFQQSVDLVDVTGEIGIVPTAVGQVYLVSTNIKLGGTGVDPEEIRHVLIDAHNKGLGDVATVVTVAICNIDGGVGAVGAGSTGGALVVDATVAIGGLISFFVIGKAVCFIRFVILLEPPGQIVHVSRAVEGRNNVDVVFLADFDDLKQIIGGKIPAGIGVGTVGILDPGLDMAAADPGEVVFRLIIAVIAFRKETVIPQVGAETAVLGEVKLQGVITHPGHFPDEVADPFCGEILPGAVKLDGALLGIRGVVGGETPDRVAAAVAEMLLEHIQTVQQAIHVPGNDGGVAFGDDLIALSSDIDLAGIDLDKDITGAEHLGVSPDNIHGFVGGDFIGSKLPLGQLNGLQQLAAGVAFQEEPTVTIQSECAVVGLKIVHQLAHITGVGRGFGGDHKGKPHNQNQRHQQSDAPDGNVCFVLFHIKYLPCTRV